METQKYYREVLKKLRDLEVSMENISSGDQDPLLIVSQTEPVNPSDGLLWYKPDLCLTTTTTTVEETTTTTTTTTIPCDYEGVLTVGQGIDTQTGYMLTQYGSINPGSLEVLSVIYDDNPNYNLQVVTSECFNSVVLHIDENEYILDWYEEVLGLYNRYMIIGILINPLPSVGETCNIQICFGDECSTTTTTQPI